VSTHAQLSPSKAHRWTVCPGSIREEAKYPDTSGPAAVDGTHSHTLLEKSIMDDRDPMTYVGETLSDHEGEFVVDKDRANRVANAYAHIKHRAAELDADAIIAETRVNPALLLDRNDCSGTVDVQIRAGTHIDIIDYKDGMGVVDVKDNKQLELYALGVLAENLGNIQTIRMTIIQPKLAMRGMKAITSYDMLAVDLLARVDQYKAAAAATDKSDAPLVPGDSQCKFCKAKGSCGALASNVMEAIGMFKSIDIAQQAADKNPNELSDDQIREIVESAPLVRQLLKAVEAEALRRFEAGVTIPGLKAVYGRGTRAWALPEEEMADKLTRMGIPKSSIFETKLITPAKAEKLTWEKKDGEKKHLSDRQLKTLETEYIKKSQGKLTIVPESDHRQAVVLDAAPMFGAVNSEPEIPAWLK
jgi:Protein of unknown function (DUF2800)